MKYLLPIIFFISLTLKLYSQETKVSNIKFIAGLSGPELLHAGFTYRIANISLVGLNIGAAPSPGEIWPSINLEHRFYFGKNEEFSQHKSWFFRQGTTFFPSEKPSKQFTLNLTVGKDFIFKKGKNGITIDAGAFYLPESERSSIILVKALNLLPALRFEFFFSL